MSLSCYGAALRLIAARELSVAQVRERLRRKDYPEPEIEAAIERLVQNGSLNDRRVALARARSSMKKGRGRARIGREIETLGIDRSLVREALETTFSEVDEQDVLDAALTRRLRGRSILDAAHLRRLHQALLRQGFSSSDIMAALKRRRTSDPS